MNESLRLTLLLLVSLSVYLAAGKYTCTQPGTFGCNDCGTLVMCQGTATAPTSTPVKCSAGQACTNTSATAAGCSKTTSDTANPCKCEKGPAYLPDPFDVAHYIMCVAANQQYYRMCDVGKVFDPTKKICVVAPPEPTTTTLPPIACTEFGFFTNDPTCKSYYTCLPDETDPNKLVSSKSECGTDLYFDERTSECVASSVLQPSEFKCPTGGSGGFIDTAECTKFYTCFEGTPSGEPLCCAVGERFSQANMKCVPAAEVPDSDCPQISKCLGPSSFNATCPSDIITSTSSSSISSVASGSSISSGLSSTSSGSPSTSSSGSSSTSSSGSFSTSSSGSSSTSSSGSSSTSSSGSSSISFGSSSTSALSSSSSLSSIATTTSSTITSGATPDCSKDGAVPYPGNCSKYYWCSGGKYQVQTCPSQMLFDKVKRYCNAAASVVC